MLYGTEIAVSSEIIQKKYIQCKQNVQGVPLSTEPGISLIIVSASEAIAT
jgi:hypothetical protein